MATSRIATQFKKITMLAPFGMRPKGTLALRMLPLAQELYRQGHQVRILAPSDLNPTDAGSREEHGGVIVEHLPLPARQGLAGMLTTPAAMVRRTLADRPSLVHLFKPKGYGGMAALLLRLLAPGLPLVVDSDDWEGRGGWNERLPYPALLKRLIDWQERNLPRMAGAVTVASRTLETQIWGNGVAPERVFYLPNGVRRGWRSYPPRAEARRRLGLDQRPTALLYTRFWEFPVEQLVAALVGLVALQPKIRLLVLGVGENREEQHLQALAERAGVAGALDQRGWADEPTIVAALAAVDVYLYPMSDTLINRAKAPAKLLEPMHAALPIVAAGVGEVPIYLDHGSCGMIIPPDAPGALAAGVAGLLADPAAAQRLGQRARRRVDTVLAWDRLVPLALQAYAAAGAPRPSADVLRQPTRE